MRKGIDCKDKEWEEIKLYCNMKNIAGQKFERLTALFPVMCNGQRQWLCKCDCGNELVVKCAQLKNKNTKSCGCGHRDIMKQRWENFRENSNIIGQKFGRLTVDSFVGIKNSHAIYHFNCECGNTIDLPIGRVKSGITNSCGCLWTEWNDYTKTDIIGQRFGKLTVISYAGVDKRGSTLFKCLCDCGNTTVVARYSLIDNRTHSCGCIVSVGESNIKKILTDAQVIYKPQYSFSDLKSDMGGYLLYDFAILDDDGQVQRLIEFDGKQHYQAYDFFGGEEKLLKQQYHDYLKNQYALSHNIPLVRIPYIKRDSMILDDLLGPQYLIKEEN